MVMNKYAKLLVIKLVLYVLLNIIYFIALYHENQLLLSLSFSEIVMNHLTEVIVYLFFAIMSVIIGGYLIVQIKKIFNDNMDLSMKFCVIYIAVILSIILICIWMIQNPILRIVLALVTAGVVFGNSK